MFVVVFSKIRIQQYAVAFETLTIMCYNIYNERLNTVFKLCTVCYIFNPIPSYCVYIWFTSLGFKSRVHKSRNMKLICIPKILFANSCPVFPNWLKTFFLSYFLI